jgi:hypothetical protein
MPNEIYTFHVDGELLRSTKGQSYWKRKKTWVFVDIKAAERQAETMRKESGLNIEIVRYTPADD